MSIPKIDKAIIEEYKKLDSTSISDAMDRHPGRAVWDQAGHPRDLYVRTGIYCKVCALWRSEGDSGRLLR